ncbi:S8 family serine peptidase [Glycomyces arizonensis]|uniref:S8 family serine peptidase n=1 Tax=Glycomyces arizonensis TaxID=256035 RepID=UPI0004067E73|nr:S8 family serine peptidase [Glycomyces arizonensis]
MTTPLVSPRSAAAGALLGAAALFAAVTVAPSAALAQEEKDLYAENAWAIDQIGAETAWETTKGEGVTVAVVDTGIAEEHPFLEDKNILDGKSFMSGDEPNGRVDGDGHGTGVAAAVLYAAPDATILPVRTGSSSINTGFSTGAGQVQFDGIRWAADNGADVIVIPWVEVSQAEPDEEFLGAVQYAIDQDVVVVAGGGNDPSLEKVPNPAYFPGVVAVSGTDENGDPWSMSTTGPEIVLAGPAGAMVFPDPQTVDFGDEPLYFDAAGTSAASGLVGGVAALVRSAYPDLDASNTIQRLISTADDHGEGRTEALGFGEVDADAAVNSDDVEAVTENPLGYPLGEAGASEALSDDESAEPTGDASSEPASENQAEASDDSDGNGLLLVFVIAAAVILAAAGLAVWLVLRSQAKSRRRVQPWQ